MLTSYSQIELQIIKKFLTHGENNDNCNTVDNNNKLMEIITKKLNFKLYDLINKVSDFNTLLYMFNHISSGIFVKIKNNKIKAYIPFENKYFKNNWSKNIKLDKSGDNFLYNFINYRNKYLKRKTRYINNIQFWHANANIINNEKYDDSDGYIPHGLADYYNIINDTIDNYKICDCTFYINKRDSCVLQKDLLEPYPSLYVKEGEKAPKLEHKYQDKYYTPVLSPYSNENYADLPFIIPEDWKLALSSNDFSISESDRVEWRNKIPTAFFRGSGTGSVEFNKNQRLQISKIDYEWSIIKPDLLDAGIVSWNARDKINSNLTITYIKPSEMAGLGIFLKKRVEMNKQLKYKYLINIDGHSKTNRFSYLLQTGCLILNVESKYVIGNQRWYDHLLIPYVHYVPIKYDLSDLEEIILWCRNNDIKCKEIVNNAKKIYYEYFSKEGLMKYCSNVLNNISYKR